MAQVGAENSITIDGRLFTGPDFTNLISLHAATNVAGTRAVFRRATGTAGYTPAGGRKFQVVALVLMNRDATANVAHHDIGSVSVDIGFDSAAAFTAPAMMCGGTAGNKIFVVGAESGIRRTEFAFSPEDPFTLAAAAFLGFESNRSNQAAIAYGYDVVV